ncbi:hypothetical protein ASG55_09070 [Pseudomonas sp. Leaf434]|nr:hypothetical protein ASG55_09070 [Pseudomonas sp. Leaf434]
MRKRCCANISRRNDKALNNQGFVVSNMAEAMGFELMDLLQSTVFKTQFSLRYVYFFLTPLQPAFYKGRILSFVTVFGAISMV